MDEAGLTRLFDKIDEVVKSVGAIAVDLGKVETRLEGTQQQYAQVSGQITSLSNLVSEVVKEHAKQLAEHDKSFLGVSKDLAAVAKAADNDLTKGLNKVREEFEGHVATIRKDVEDQLEPLRTDLSYRSTWRARSAGWWLPALSLLVAVAAVIVRVG